MSPPGDRTRSGSDPSPGAPRSEAPPPDDAPSRPSGDAPREALDHAFRYLSYRSRSAAELERYLRRKGYDPAVVARVLSRCEELGYVDDRAFAAAFVRDRIRLKPRGVFRLRAELRGKGVGESDAEAGIRRAFRETGTTERELLERAAEERWRRVGADEPRAARRRLFDYLRRRGFPYAEIRDVVEEYLEGR